MKPAFWARRAHKWIALVIGVQALLWTAGGLYMTVISIDFIHGDHLVHSNAKPLSSGAGLIDSDVILKRYSRLESFRLTRFMDREIYEVHHAGGIAMIDARSGAEIGPVDQATARRLALSVYQGDGPLTAIRLIEEAPQEVSTQAVPMWQATFGDRLETNLYFSPQTGELLATRHMFWRLFDFLWMLHIMDYEERSDVNNTLLRVATTVGLLFALSGVWLLFYSFRRKRSAP